MRSSSAAQDWRTRPPSDLPLEGDDFEGRPHPTEFRFLNLPSGEVLERNCHLGQRTRIDFATNVEDNYFDRAILPGVA